MKVAVTFDEINMAIQPVFDTIIPMDISSIRVQSVLDGTMRGEYINEDITSLRLGAFAGCGDLTKISLPICTEFFGRYTFNECKNVTELSLPSLTTIEDGNYTFYGMESLEEINLPRLTTVSSFTGTFWNCKKAKRISLPELSGQTIGSFAFRYCYQLETLILGGDALNPLGNTNAFASAGINAPNGLSIYVPDNLVAAYKTATNWAAYADKIKPISELEG